MTTYYQDDYVTLYHGDCRELLPSIEADVVVTDPPYGMRYAVRPPNRGGKPIAGEHLAPVVGDDQPFDPTPIIDLGLPTVMFGGNHYASRLPDSRSWLVWDKRDGVMQNTMADCEMAWSNLGGPERIFRHVWGGFLRDSQRGEPTRHPTEKPVALMVWCIEQMPSGTILDPFAGSGTTLVAAKSLNRKAIGIEIEERYCEVAANRLRQEVLGLT